MDKKFESEEGTVERLIENELMDDIEFLGQLSPDTNEYTIALANVKTLHDMWLEEEKLGLDYGLRHSEIELKHSEIEHTINSDKMKARDWVNLLVETNKVILPLAALIGITVMGWHNENHPITPSTITSNTTRQSTGILGRFIR